MSFGPFTLFDLVGTFSRTMNSWDFPNVYNKETGETLTAVGSHEMAVVAGVKALLASGEWEVKP